MNLQSNDPDPFQLDGSKPFLGYTLQTSQIPYNNVNKINFPKKVNISPLFQDLHFFEDFLMGSDFFLETEIWTLIGCFLVLRWTWTWTWTVTVIGNTSILL